MNFLNNLNSEQRKAVEHFGSPLIIYAGAGTGKTRVITYKIAYLLKQYKMKPYRILAVTFTNKAASEMKHRIKNLVGVGADYLWMSTFHSFGFRFLKNEYHHFGYSSNISICDEAAQKALIKQCLEELKISPKENKPSFFQYHFGLIKSDLKDINEYLNNIPYPLIREMVHDVYHLYEKHKKKMNLFDFDDLIYLPVKLFYKDADIVKKYSKKFDYILVDEFQDTNVAQYNLLKYLSFKNQNIAIVGDDDQSIYSWRGASVKNIFNFKQDFKNVHIISLVQNYRSSQTILDVSNKLIANNTHHVEKKLFSQYNNYNEPQWYNFSINFDEARFVAEKILEYSSDLDLSNIAVFYRTNSQSRIIEEELLNHNIPYIIVGGTGFYQRKEIKDILSYFKFMVNPLDTISLIRIINEPKRAIGKASIDRLLKIADENNVSMFEVIMNIDDFDFKSSKKIKKFAELITDLTLYEKENNLSDFIDYFIDKIGYIEMLENSNDLNSEDRIQNVEELCNGIKMFYDKNPEAKLFDYVESISLISDIDSWDQSRGFVNLMTLHSAKGLEFDIVFLIGLNDGILPHYNSLSGTDDGNDEGLEEERRLCYVGITRAKELLFLTSSETLFQYGNYNPASPSRFIYEMFE